MPEEGAVAVNPEVKYCSIVFVDQSLTWIISRMISAYFKDNISLPVWLHGIHSACTGRIATAQHATYATHFHFLCTTTSLKDGKCLTIRITTPFAKFHNLPEQLSNVPTSSVVALVAQIANNCKKNHNPTAKYTME
ncbi:hypothetical protein T07_7905 [Trichinella nelsoni]|uniref:Uncharacterized protein n=1 Tax=Trichinella nelsoni TaxID=6336 RepID=A0A0V0RRV0_9BILA|nr:hypothetical protein T07_7905 [Trichinella nelsoni]